MAKSFCLQSIYCCHLQSVQSGIKRNEVCKAANVRWEQLKSSAKRKKRKGSRSGLMVSPAESFWRQKKGAESDKPLTLWQIFGDSKSFRAGQRQTQWVCQRVGNGEHLFRRFMSARYILLSACNVCGIDTVKVMQNDASIHKSFLALFSLSSRGGKK